MAPSNSLFSRGSLWQRWDPHLHAPGTIFNDRFSGSEVWEKYLSRIEMANPTVVALGVTDYWSLDLYERILEYKREGRLPDVELIFPNIEIRFGIGTERGSPVNGHLLVSPEDPGHIERTRRFLETLSFKARNETYRCKRDELIALGRAHAGNALEDAKALEIGTMQFKVSPRELGEAFADSEWARANILVGVAAASDGGTSGLSKDASLAATRREIERMADVIFSGNPEDRAYWLGETKLSIQELLDIYDGAKPCLHGSDAHALEEVCEPALDRRTWIKGEVTFESLRQAVIEPGTRVFIGKDAPEGALPYRVIESIELRGADWCSPKRFELNRGLVGIIGARGSGKTALADLIATGARSREGRENDRSFIRRAADHLAGLEISLTWGDDETWDDGMNGGSGALVEESGVQYLSQQFVERLCGAESGVSKELLAEIERVIFEEHPEEERLGATSFTELLDLRASRTRLSRNRSREALERAVKTMFEERRKEAELTSLKAKQAIDVKTIADDRAARKALISKGTEDRAKRLEEIQTELERRQQQIDTAARRKEAIDQLGDFVADARGRRAAEELEDLMQNYAAAGLAKDEWEAFARDFTGDVDAILAKLRTDAKKELAALLGEEVKDDGSGGPFVADGADLTKTPRTPLAQEAERLRAQIGIDAKRAAQLASLDRKIAQAETALTQLNEQIVHAENSGERIESLRGERKSEYGHVFDAIIEEEAQLEDLYAPLADKLVNAKGAMAKLSFEVRREVDIKEWAEAGEELLDLRKAGPFKGHGALLTAVEEELLPAWKSGSSAEVTEALSKFRENHDRSLLEHSPVPSSDRERYWQWAAQVANWLDGTAHIKIRYGIQYDGVDIEQLSPGTRGIVLLLLYLSIDQTDDRPLIIDQPEENLDPKSIFDELVDRFRETRTRRQVIVVTHNANLVINTDADQIIVAESGPHQDGALPEMTYRSGGLENPEIRRQVCDILEGGQQAFVQRAKRLRVRLTQER